MVKMLKSFGHALRGLALAMRAERNFSIELAIAVLVLAAAVFLELPSWKIVAILFAVILVLSLELVNSIVERMVDAFHPRVHPTAGELKDLAAAAVLFVSLGAAVIGVILFWPHIANFVK